MIPTGRHGDSRGSLLQDRSVCSSFFLSLNAHTTHGDTDTQDRHTHSQTHRHRTDTFADTHTFTDTQTHTQKDRHTYLHTPYSAFISDQGSQLRVGQAVLCAGASRVEQNG